MKGTSFARLRSVGLEFGVQIAVLVLLIVTLSVVAPQFHGSSAVFATLEGFALVGLVALGVAVTMIAGEIDLSVASMAALAAVVAVRLAPLGLVATIGLTVLLCVALGTVQGYLIAKMRINSIVFTVGTLVLLQGLAWIVSSEGPVQLTDFTISDALIVRWGVLSPSSLIAIVVLVMIGVVLHRTRFGKEIYAIGGGRREALLAGVRLGRPITWAFAISAGCAGLAGALAAIRGGSAAPNSFSALLLSSIAAALIGGISLAGGRGGIVHVVIGVLVLSTLSAGLAARGAPDYVVSLVTGGVLLVTVGARAALQAAAQAMQRRRRAQIEAGIAHQKVLGSDQVEDQVANEFHDYGRK